jgi:hypothetical protein
VLWRRRAPTARWATAIALEVLDRYGSDVAVTRRNADEQVTTARLLQSHVDEAVLAETSAEQNQHRDDE